MSRRGHVVNKQGPRLLQATGHTMSFSLWEGWRSLGGSAGWGQVPAEVTPLPSRASPGGHRSSAPKEDIRDVGAHSWLHSIRER